MTPATTPTLVARSNKMNKTARERMGQPLSGLGVLSYETGTNTEKNSETNCPPKIHIHLRREPCLLLLFAAQRGCSWKESQVFEAFTHWGKVWLRYLFGTEAYPSSTI
eukprot:5696029-Amphidinium_carterae.1